MRYTILRNYPVTWDNRKRFGKTFYLAKVNTGSMASGFSWTRDASKVRLFEDVDELYKALEQCNELNGSQTGRWYDFSVSGDCSYIEELMNF